MKLRIKPKYNPPRIGKATEEGLIATKEFSVPSDQDLKSPMFLVGLIEMEEEFLKEFCEVITEELCQKEN